MRKIKEPDNNGVEVFEAIDISNSEAHYIIKALHTDSYKHNELLNREREVLETLQWEALIEEVELSESYALNVPTLKEEEIIEVHIPGCSLPVRCLVLNAIEGETLAQWVRLYGKIGQKIAVDWMTQLFKILDRLHESNILHRDIKPENILINANGKISLIDFGSARFMDEDYRIRIAMRESSLGGDTSHRDLTIVGTEGYAPIEQFQGKAIPQSDFFAVGRTMIFALTGIKVRNIKIDGRTGDLLWEKKTSGIDKPVKRFINQLTAPGINSRPNSSRQILQYLAEGLPNELKKYQTLRSPWVRVGGTVAFLALCICTYQFTLSRLASFYRSQGEAAQLNQQTEEARRMYESALGYAPNDIKTLTNLAMVCQLLRDEDCAKQNYQRAVQLNPNYMPAQYNLGIFYEDQGDTNLARQHYVFASQSPDEIGVLALNNLSRLENTQSHFSEAVEFAREGLRRRSDASTKGALYKNLGWGLWQQGELEKADTALKSSIQLAPAIADAYCIRAQVKTELNDLQTAKADWETCLQLNSENPEVRAWRKLFLDRVLPNNHASP